MIGQTISHYQILEKLGEGGMGVVYKAQDTKLDRVVALKFLPAHLSASDSDKARFVQEAKSASALNHPNICTIHDIQESDGQFFIVMELVEGQTLKDLIMASGSAFLQPKRAIDIGIQIAEGLAAAHEKGIVHRDIKPENIMVRKDGIVQIMDFGLAKFRASGSKITRLTKEGSTVGTAGYMSPEQVQGQDVDHRSDIFSLGVLLYELFTGQLPFKGVHETALMYEIVNVDAAPMSSIKPDIDQSLERIVLECLEKDPNERTQSAKQIAIDLRRSRRESSRQRASRIIPTPSIPAPGSIEGSRQSYRRFIWPSVTMVLLTLLALALWRPWHSASVSSIPITRLSILLPPDAKLIGGFRNLSMSPDGRFLAYGSSAIGTGQLYIRRMNELSYMAIPGTNGAGVPTFSPDGNWIAYDAGDKIRKVSLFGGAPQDVCEIRGLVRGIHWAGDGNIYFGHINKGIHRVSENGGEPEIITTLDSAAGEISHRTPEFLVRENVLIYTVKLSNISTFDDAIIVAERLGSKERHVLIRGGSDARAIPTGYLVYGRQSGLFAAPFDIAKLQVLGPPSKVIEGGWFNPYSGDACYGVTINGTLVFVPLGSQSFDVNTIAWMDRSGKLQPLIDDPRSYFSGTLSPDGGKLAITVQAANDDIWVYHFGRKSMTRLTFGGGNHGFPIWTPDGRYVIYQAERGQSGNLYKRPWDGGGSEERLTNIERHQVPNSISPDGKHLAYLQDGDIWILPLSGDKSPFLFVRTAANENFVTFSPDGKYLAYDSNESGRSEIYVVPFPGKDGKWQVSSGGGYSPMWAQNGKELFYNATEGTMMSVPVSLSEGFDFGSPTRICKFPVDVFPPIDVSRDGTKFLVVRGRGEALQTSEIHVVLNWFEELKDKMSTRAH